MWKRPKHAKSVLLMLVTLGLGLSTIAGSHSASTAVNCNAEAATSSSGSSSATQTSVTTPVVVTAVNDYLVQAYTTNMVITVPILSNDTPNGTVSNSSIDLDPATAGIQQSLTTSDGVWTVQPNNTVTFAPSSAGTATISYQYAITNGDKSNVATITVKTAYAPTANDVNETMYQDNNNNDYYDGIPITVTPGSGQTIDWSSVDLDPSTPGIQSTFTTGDGAIFTYDASTHTVDFSRDPGTDNPASITFTVSDTDGLTSNQATITVFGD